MYYATTSGNYNATKMRFILRILFCAEEQSQTDIYGLFVCKLWWFMIASTWNMGPQCHVYMLKDRMHYLEGRLKGTSAIL
jgi:hypothetical protein